MSAEEPETEAGAANDATEVVDDDFSTRLRSVGGGQAETQEAWSDDDDAADDVEPEGQPWSVVTGHAAALLSVGAAVAAAIAVLGWMMLHKDRPAPSPAAGKSTSPAAAPASPPPPTVTQTVSAAPPPAPVTTTSAAPASVLSDDDHRLLHTLRSVEGYEVDNPALVVGHAHRYCSLVQQGFSGYQAWQTVVSESNDEVGMHLSIPRPLMGAARTPTEMAWNILTADATTIYPNCRD